jgi:hypothetical protein
MREAFALVLVLAAILAAGYLDNPEAPLPWEPSLPPCVDGGAYADDAYWDGLCIPKETL